jgi:hypothetical protein
MLAGDRVGHGAQGAECLPVPLEAVLKHLDRTQRHGRADDRSPAWGDAGHARLASCRSGSARRAAGTGAGPGPRPPASEVRRRPTFDAPPPGSAKRPFAPGTAGSTSGWEAEHATSSKLSGPLCWTLSLATRPPARSLHPAAPPPHGRSRGNQQIVLARKIGGHTTLYVAAWRPPGLKPGAGTRHGRATSTRDPVVRRHRSSHHHRSTATPQVAAQIRARICASEEARGRTGAGPLSRSRARRKIGPRMWSAAP